MRTTRRNPARGRALLHSGLLRLLRSTDHRGYGLTSQGATLVGTTLGKYHLTELLGAGGMAEVYRAVQTGLNRTVAIKVMYPHLAREEGFQERFRREAEAIAALRHPNIVQIYDSDQDRGWYYMVMEYAAGGTLTQRLLTIHSQGQIMPLPEVYRLMQAIGSALAYAHGAGMIHRDIKPANIMFTAKDEPLLTDFGIVRLVDETKVTQTGVMTGTPAYMSPEQGMGQRTDKRSDIYSLGVMLYEMATGSLPYLADTPFGLIMKHVQEPLPPPQTLNPALPTALAQVIEKTLAKQPDDRYQTATEFVTALEEASRNEASPLPAEKRDEVTLVIPPHSPVATKIPSSPPLPPLPHQAGGQRRLALLGVGGVLAISLLVALIAGLFLWRYWSSDSNVPMSAAIMKSATVNLTTPSPQAAIIPPPAAAPAVELSPVTAPTETLPVATPQDKEPGGQVGERITLVNTPSPSPAATTTPPPTPISPELPAPTPTPSPALTGRLLYVSNRDGDFEIYLKSLGIDRPDEKLTDNENIDDWFPGWSGDGSRIVFTSNRSGNYDLYTMEANGGSQNVYVSTSGWDEYGYWGPGLDQLVFVTTAETDGVSNAELFRREADGTQTRLTWNQAEDRNPVWSPTGEIFYASNANGNWDIYVLSATAGADQVQPRNLTNHPAVDEDPAVSPDAQRLVFIRKERDTNEDGQIDDGDTGNIYLMKTDGSEVRLVTSTQLDNSPAWSPDGAWVVYSRAPNPGSQASDLYATRLADGQTIQITDDQIYANWGAAWAE